MLLHRLWPGAIERESVRGERRTFLYAPPQGGGAVLRLVVDPPNLLLHFAAGAALPDPAALLRGEGRRGRYLCLRDPALCDSRHVRALIGAAVAAGQ